MIKIDLTDWEEDMMKTRRIMWLLNHTTLRAFEVPLLIDMGYEVFCPKSFPYNEGNLSASVEWKYDDTLTIPKDDLEVLNQADFYNEVSEEVKILMNKYFDIVFFVAIRDQIKMVVNSFKGCLVFRTFGLAGGSNYTQNIILSCGYSTMLKIEEAGERFFFGYGYESMPEVESRFMKTHGLYLPLGLKNAEFNNSWVGGDKRILFVCPRINTSPYFHDVYEKFKKDFSEFDYLIGGAQPIAVQNDPRVLGFIPNEQYEYNMKNLAVMFYHSRERRHIHYHPFEAIKNGMPLIFMAEGLLDTIGGDKLPGRCKTEKEARKKIRRIMQGDKKFINQIVESQKVLLEPFKYNYCREYWEKAFAKIEDCLEKLDTSEKAKKLAIILPGTVNRDNLRKARNLIEAIKKSTSFNNKKFEIVFGYVQSQLSNSQEITNLFSDAGVDIRQFHWSVRDQQWVKNAMELRGYPFEYVYGTYCVMDDGINYFCDCDYVIFTDLVSVDKLFMEKPYAICVNNLNLRYMEYNGGIQEQIEIENLRSADKVIVYNKPVYEDAIQYIGVNRQKVLILPELIEAYESHGTEDKYMSESYFIWHSSNIMDKNIERFLDILEIYYKIGGKLKCILAGDWSNIFDEYSALPYVQNMKQSIKKKSTLKRNIKCLRPYRAKEYSVIKNASFIVDVDSLEKDITTYLEYVLINPNVLCVKTRCKMFYEHKWKIACNYMDIDRMEYVAKILLEFQKNENSICDNVTIEHIADRLGEQVSALIF